MGNTRKNAKKDLAKKTQKNPTSKKQNTQQATHQDSRQNVCYSAAKSAHKDARKESFRRQPSTKCLSIFSILFLLLAIIFTVLVATFNVAPAAPDGVEVGFSALNSDMAKAFPFNKTWYLITSSTWVVLPIFIFSVFYAGLGLYQLIKRKSLKKVDRELFILAGFYLAVAAVYIIFEKLLVINYRPVILGEGPESSYPSSHTLFSLCLCGSAIMINQRLRAKIQASPQTTQSAPQAAKAATKTAKHTTQSVKYLSIFIGLVNILLAAFAVFVVIGRFLSGVHWLTDIMGGIIISATLLIIFYFILSLPANSKQR